MFRWWSSRRNEEEEEDEYEEEEEEQEEYEDDEEEEDLADEAAEKGVVPESGHQNGGTCQVGVKPESSPDDDPVHTAESETPVSSSLSPPTTTTTLAATSVHPQVSEESAAKATNHDNTSELEEADDINSTADDDDDDDDNLLEDILVPIHVDTTKGSNRERAPSGLTLGEDSAGATQEEEEEDDDEEEEDPVKELHRPDEEEEEEPPTSLEEKQSLLLLAAEHDRVDILQSILAGDDRETLLNDASRTIPPLHVAVSYGSIHATNCLLRMGANPALRPQVSLLRAQQNATAVVEIPNMNRFDDASAWEIAFGTASGQDSAEAGRWSLFGRRPSSSGEESSSDPTSRPRRRSIRPADLPQNKRAALQHAFTAEALRAIGSDEVARLHQLLEAGMPADLEIAHKTLYDWTVEMGALQCEELLRPAEAARHGGTPDDQTTADTIESEPPTPIPVSSTVDHHHEPAPSAVLDRSTPGDESVPSLRKRLDELESLARGLSVCLDDLAEEVSVCSGLLLVGSGAAALASHVRSLKATKERKVEELERMQEAWENSEDELAYWRQKVGPQSEHILSQPPATVSSAVVRDVEDEEVKKQLLSQIGSMEFRIRQLRASIADLSDENVRTLAEVGRRGLSGGITLVRGLRDEIREVDFQLSETKAAEAACQSKICRLQEWVKTKETSKTNGVPALANSENNQAIRVEAGENEDLEQDLRTSFSNSHSEPEAVNGAASDSHVAIDYRPSEIILTGQSTALSVRGNRGFLSFWQILMRIIGLRSEEQQDNRATASHVMTI